MEKITLDKFRQLKLNIMHFTSGVDETIINMLKTDNFKINIFCNYNYSSN